MSARCDNAEELGMLLAALREDTINDAEAKRLVMLLRNDPLARKTYIRQMAIVADLHNVMAGASRPSAALLEDYQGIGVSASYGEGETCSAAVNDMESRVTGQGSETSGPHFPLSSIPPIVLDLSSPAPSPLFSLHSPVGSFVFSWTTAAVILGVGLLIGMAWKVHNDRQFVQNAPLRSSLPTDWNQETLLVGHISGMTDCVLAEAKIEIVDKAPVLAGKQVCLWPRASWKSPTTPGPRSSCKGRARMRSTRPPAASSRSAS